MSSKGTPASASRSTRRTISTDSRPSPGAEKICTESSSTPTGGASGEKSQRCSRARAGEGGARPSSSVDGISTPPRAAQPPASRRRPRARRRRHRVGRADDGPHQAPIRRRRHGHVEQQHVTRPAARRAPPQSGPPPWRGSPRGSLRRPRRLFGEAPGQRSEIGSRRARSRRAVPRSPRRAAARSACASPPAKSGQIGDRIEIAELPGTARRTTRARPCASAPSALPGATSRSASTGSASRVASSAERRPRDAHEGAARARHGEGELVGRARDAPTTSTPVAACSPTNRRAPRGSRRGRRRHEALERERRHGGPYVEDTRRIRRSPTPPTCGDSGA